MSVDLGQIKVKSLPCNVLEIAEFETVITEPTAVNAADCILVKCYHKKRKFCKHVFPKVEIWMLFVGCFNPLVLEEALVTDVDVSWLNWVRLEPISSVGNGLRQFDHSWLPAPSLPGQNRWRLGPSEQLSTQQHGVAAA